MEDYALKIEEEILDQYLNDISPRPWIVAFSGGKDSTMLLHLVWNALKRIKVDKRTRPIHIVCNNTLVENPKILIYVNKQLELIKSASTEQQMPFSVEHTLPSLNDTFWVNLIGRGYVAPNSGFRWCTERLKIRPTTRYILDKVSQHGEVIVLLGTRKAESSTRARTMKKHEIVGTRLSKHQLLGAYVYSPIKNLSTDQVWWYLAQNESPWHSDHIELVHIYRNASDNNDCPLITDISTPPCGQSRFGCWVCTVVQSDKTMNSLIESGERWLLPLLELRNFLAKTTRREDPDYDPTLYRMPVKRNFQEGPGPYWPKLRKEILEKLLVAQVTIQKERPDIQLITQQELVTIQVIWHRDFIYEFSISDIYNSFYGDRLKLNQSDEAIQEEQGLLRKICNKHRVDYEIIKNLLKAEKNRMLLMNKRGIQKDLENILYEYVIPTFTDVYKENSNK